MFDSSRPKSLRWAGLSIVGVPVLLFSFILMLPTPDSDATAGAANDAVAGEDPTQFAVVDAIVFDGERVIDGADVWVEHGRIRAVGVDLELPEELHRVDGSGKTLLPGWVDSHVHTWATGRADAVRFGVTTLLDQFTSTLEVKAARQDRKNGGAQGKSDLFSAGTLATVDGGHGTQFGIDIPQVNGPDGAAAWVKARKLEGSDWIKIVVEPGWGRKLPTLDMATVAALIQAAHAEELLAVVHVSTLDDALKVAELGADGLVHVWRDRMATDEEIERLKRSGIFVIPTLVVAEGMTPATSSEAMADGPLGPHLSKSQQANLKRRFPPESSVDGSVPTESVRRLATAGVPILAGSDAPNPSTAMGFSLHRELELLTQVGLSPEAALAAATSVPTRAFGIPDRGRIAEGFLADLVLVDGDPTTRISDTQKIVRVWKTGRTVSLKPRTTAEGRMESAKAPNETLLADFEDGLSSRFGHGWTQTTDSRMGGQSKVTLEVRDGALFIRGELRQGSMYPWAGATVFPGPGVMHPIDLSGRKQLIFKVRGDGREYSAMVLSGDMQGVPPMQSFKSTESWTTVTLALEGFGSADPSQLRGISFAATGDLGAFELELDDVEIR